jgi:competence protein ComEC
MSWTAQARRHTFVLVGATGRTGLAQRAAWQAMRRLAERSAAMLAAWADAERGRFALWLPMFMAAGAASYLLLRAEPPGWLGLALSLGALLVRVAGARVPPLRLLGAVGLAASLGFLSGQCATWRAPPPLDVPSRAAVVTGKVSAVEPLPQGRRVTLEHPSLATGAAGQSPPSARGVRIRLRRDDTAPIATGDELKVRALLSRPAPPAYPGAWDLQRDAFFSGMGAYGFALGPSAVMRAASPSGLSRLLQRVREGIATRIAAALPPAEAGIAITLLTGSPSAVPAEDKAAFRDSGLAHLLAIAGLHIGIVMALAFGATRLVLACSEWAALHWPLKAIAAIASLAAGGLYMALTGAHVPIVRSFAMACLFTVAVLSGRRAFSLRGWALAMAVLVLAEPDAVLGVSFQMSFSAVLALIAGYDALRPWLRRLRGQGGPWRSLLTYVVGLAITSALAGSASAPYAAYHFGRVQLYFVLANMAAVPITALWIMPLGLCALMLMPLHGEALPLLLMGWGERAILWVGRTVAALPQAVVAVPPLPAWGLLLMTLGGAWLGLWSTRVRLLGIAAIAAGAAAFLFARPPDLLVSPDARLIGLRTARGAYAEAARGADRFTRDAWAQVWAVPALAEMPGASGDPDLACDDAACRWRAPSGGVAVIARAPQGPAACDAAVIVSAEPVRLHCPRPVPVVDRFSVWREGAHGIWLGRSGAVVLSEQAVRGVRPWTPPPHRGRATAGLPMAPLDTPPD